MPQNTSIVSPKFLNLDTSFEELKPTEAAFIKNMTWDINANPTGENGTANPSGEGQNLGALTPVRSNVAVPSVLLPDEGWNRTIGIFESETTNEIYHFNYNSLLNHGIYVLSGDTGLWQKVIIDPELAFSDDQENFIATHRVRLRFTKDAQGNITEKYIFWTDGQKWQGWISVIAAIRTNGYDSAAFPYWNLKQPHFDRRELLEWPVRPPMIKAVTSLIPNTPDDLGKRNNMIDTAFQFAYSFQNTDLRPSKASPYSLPVIVKSESFLNNPDFIPKKALVKLYAGSALIEKIYVYVRVARKDKNSDKTITEWGDWYLYDVIEKFTDCGENAPEVIGNDYWLRTNPFSGFNYDPIFNTVDYVFDNSKVYQIIPDQVFFNEPYTRMPQLSFGLADLNDSVLLGNNRYGYPNFACSVIDNIDVEVVEKAANACIKPLRKISLYAYIGRCGDDFSYVSQVGFYFGGDKQMRFGGIVLDEPDSITFVDLPESKSFGLDFADKTAFACYLKGTPYYAIGEWYQVNNDSSMVKIENLLDGANPDTVGYINYVLSSGGYFVCKFNITAPAGRYDATIGRHSVNITGDYRNTSTYIYGIANSRKRTPYGDTATTIRPDAIRTFSKEMEIDCTFGDVDVWGNNADLFYIYCPYITKQGNKKYRFIEGYFRESATSSLGVELFPYQMNHAAGDDWGKYTDKNGFYWAYTKASNSDSVDVQFFCYINCAATNFTIPTSQNGSGWKQNTVNYLASHNGTGGCNRILYRGTITNLAGTQSYSNIAISIKDGGTTYTKQDGTFELAIHNGTGTPITRNVYVNAGGNFIITISACGDVPLFLFDETFAPCINCTDRVYPFRIDLGVRVDTGGETSLKEDGTYTVGIYGADLAGRQMFVNEIKDIPVSSFLQRDNTNATFFRLLLENIDLSAYPDIKWVTPCVSRNTSSKRTFDWVGDKIVYLDNNGKIVTDPASAVFCSITIDSLYNYNVAAKFNILATYQYVQGDRLRILDDGDGNLFDVATYGDPINLEIYGTNYNQAAINAGLVPPEVNTVFNTTAAQTSQDTSVTLIIRYDARLDKLIDKKGFWIELITPTRETDIIPFLETEGFYPVINGSIQEFTGFSSGIPTYTTINSIDLDFWDTYFLQRNITIPGVGSKFFSHPFQSPNITDNFGANVTSGGRRNVKNDNARQIWYEGDTIKSDDFVKEGLINGLSTFRAENQRSFSTYPWGGIVAIHSERNIIAFICENDYFITDYNFHYSYANEQGVMVTNLDNGLSTPHQKTTSWFGLRKEDTGTVLCADGAIWWLDSKNTGWVKMDYRSAIDVSQKEEQAGEQGGIQSYLNAKLAFINKWNNTHDRKDRWDCIAGVDYERGNIYLTFRNRRNNSNDLRAFVNNRRNIDLKHQETLVYSIQYHGWLMTTGFTPEAYGQLKGNNANVEMIAFGAGKPYYQNNATNTSFCEFFGIQTEQVIMPSFNEFKQFISYFQGLSHDTNPSGWFVDLIFTNFVNSYSYLSSNKFKKKETMFYAAILRNMNSYPSNNPIDLFRSMLADGYRNIGRYIVIRMIGDFSTLNQYKQLNNIYLLSTNSGANKK